MAFTNDEPGKSISLIFQYPSQSIFFKGFPASQAGLGPYFAA